MTESVGRRRSLAVVAVVLAGGTGERVGAPLPKQFLRLAGKPVLQHTLEVFERSPRVDAVVVVAPPAHLDRAGDVVRALGASKVMDVVSGGGARQESTRRALAVLASRGIDECKVLVHDAVRPLLDERIIDDCVAALDVYGAVDVVVPTADTIVELDEGGEVTDIPPRSRLRRGQTPQAFVLSVLREAHRRARSAPPEAFTDDCGLVLRYLPETPIGTVEGSERNIKITHAQDFVMADQLFRASGSLGARHRRGELAGKSVLVLGAARGIGAAIAAGLVRDGARVQAPSRYDCDIRDERAVRAAVHQAEALGGMLDAVVVTAGVLHHGPVVDESEAVLRDMLETNLWGSIAAARASHAALSRSGGQLVLFASSSYTRGRSGQVVYSASKAAIVNLVQGLAEEWSGTGARVNCISPGRTATDMRTAVSGSHLGAEVLLPEEVAVLTLDLLTWEGTGSVFDVDAGRPGSMRTIAGRDRPTRTGSPVLGEPVAR